MNMKIEENEENSSHFKQNKAKKKQEKVNNEVDPKKLNENFQSVTSSIRDL